MHLLLLVVLMSGLLTDYHFVRGLLFVVWLARIGHFDRRRTGWRALSKIPTINTTFSSSLPMTPRPDLDLIDDTHSHRLHESSRQPPINDSFRRPSPASPAPLSRLHLTQYIPIILVSS